MTWKFLLLAAVVFVDAKPARDPKAAFENLARIGNAELARMRAAAAKKESEPQVDKKLGFLRDIKFG